MTVSPRVVILGGGPADYEAALVAAQAGAHVVLVERDGLGGAAVLTDCVPSKALIATSATLAQPDAVMDPGVRIGPDRFKLGDVIGGFSNWLGPNPRTCVAVWRERASL
jgi:pyruvate/2-oxoglutarate dehydrogenase complex dihydrolipoamide dehydrogenase (E3) component